MGVIGGSLHYHCLLSIFQLFGSDAPCFGIGLEIGVEMWGGVEGGALHGVLYNLGHAGERAAVVAESLVHHLVGGIHNAGHVSALAQRLEGQGKTAELLEVGFEKFERMTLKQVEPVAVEVEPFGKR